MDRAWLQSLALGVGMVVGCQEPAARRRFPEVVVASVGPVISQPEAEVFAENPLTAFQRDGVAPRPVGRLTQGQTVQVIQQSGAFYQIESGSTGGWIAAQAVVGWEGVAGGDGGGGVPADSSDPTGGAVREGAGLPVDSPEPINLDGP